MAKNYFYIILLTILSSLSAAAQDGKVTSKNQDLTTIEGLSVYPNPVTNGKVYISTKKEAVKDIIIFDVLGKKVLQSHLSDKELNISNLTPGVYIIKITEEEATTTRKLIVR